MAGVSKPVDGHCVFAFDADGSEKWRADFSWDWRWPDCAAPSRFGCLALARGDLDGDGVAELVVSAGDCVEYGTRVSVLDPEDGRIKASFWHFGDINGLLIQEGILDDGRAGIVAWGNNNKLDGSTHRCPSDEPARTAIKVVSVVLILDPERMEGVGPPRTERTPLEPAGIHAYAFLDLPYDHCVEPDSSDNGRVEQPRLPAGEQRVYAGVGGVERTDRSLPDPLKPVLEVTVTTPSADGPNESVALLLVDRDLRLIDAMPVMGSTTSESRAFWARHWRHVVLNDEYED